VLTTTADHGIEEDWPFEIEGAKGMEGINSANRLDADGETLIDGGFFFARVPSSNTLSLNDVDAVNFDPYTDGGVVKFKAPVDLTGHTPQIVVYQSAADATVLETFDATGGMVTADAGMRQVRVNLTPAQVAALTWSAGYYVAVDVDADGNTFWLGEGEITVSL
jgi:hypothetical protein